MNTGGEKISTDRQFSWYKGTSFEHKVKGELEKLGYFVVRSARSAFPDLVGVRQGKTMLGKCKYNGHLSWNEKLRLLKLGKELVRTVQLPIFVIEE